VVSNAISGEKLSNISWGKVGVAAVEGFVADGASNVTKALTDHSIFTFSNDIQSLEEGTYKWDDKNNKFVEQ